LFISGATEIYFCLAAGLPTLLFCLLISGACLLLSPLPKTIKMGAILNVFQWEVDTIPPREIPRAVVRPFQVDTAEVAAIPPAQLVQAHEEQNLAVVTVSISDVPSTPFTLK
jgi:hypothetical protein